MVLRRANQLHVPLRRRDSNLRMRRVIPAGNRSQHDPKRKCKLKHRRPAPAKLRTQTFSEIQGHHHRDHSTTHPLQKPARKQRHKALRSNNQSHAEHKHQPARDHHLPAPEPLRQHARHQRRRHAAAKHSGHDHRGLLNSKIDRLAEKQQRRRNNANIDAIQQSAQPGDEDEVTAIVCESHAMDCSWTTTLPIRQDQEALPGALLYFAGAGSLGEVIRSRVAARGALLSSTTLPFSIRTPNFFQKLSRSTCSGFCPMLL